MPLLRCTLLACSKLVWVCAGPRPLQQPPSVLCEKADRFHDLTRATAHRHCVLPLCLCWSLCRLWPSADAPAPWQGVVRQLFGHLPGKQLLWTAAEGGRWLSTQQCLFPDAACLQSGSTDTTASSSASGVDRIASSTVAADQHSRVSGDEAGSSDGFGPLGQALVQLGLPLAVLPSSVLDMMRKYLVSGFG